jgi:hypothetical protein
MNRIGPKGSRPFSFIDGKSTKIVTRMPQKYQILRLLQISSKAKILPMMSLKFPDDHRWNPANVFEDARSEAKVEGIPARLSPNGHGVDGCDMA